MDPRTRRIALAVLALLIITAAVWQLRWHIGGHAIRIADPIIRRWAVAEVNRLSDGTYALSLSAIQVDMDSRTVAIDSVTVVTDASARDAAGSRLPALTLRFRNCLASGIDVDRLTAGKGLAIANVGCDSVAIGADVPAGIARDTSGGGFLTLRQNLDLASGIPFIQIDTIAFPQVKLALGIAGRGRSTTINFERLGVMFNSLHYDPKQPVAERRTLLSRNVSVAMDAFTGSREDADRLEIRSIRGDIADGTFEMLGFDWAPLPGPFADSLGLRDLAVDSLALSGVDWGAFLTSGDIVVNSIAIEGARVGLSASSGQASAAGAASNVPDTEIDELPWTLERTLRSLERDVTLNSASGKGIVIAQSGRTDTVRATRIASLGLTGLSFGADADRWLSTTPLGPMTINATDISHRWHDRATSLGSMEFDARSGRLAVHNFTMAPLGNDRAFVRRQRYRSDRIAVKADSVELTGMDVASFIRAGAYHANHARISGFDLDVMTDKGLPSRPVPSRHRTPQSWLQSADFDVRLDTLVATGRVQYRERMAEAAQAGVLRLERTQVTARHFTTRPRTGTADTMITLSLRTSLMGTGDLRADFQLPATSSRFDMSYRGRLGPMQATALNGFLEGATVARFEKGEVSSVDFNVGIRNGVASGTVAPIYQDLDIKLPGVARTGILGGIRRAIAQAAAEQFFLRTDNAPGVSDTVKTGTVSHRRTASETLIQTIWYSLRSGLVDGVKP